MQEPEVEQDCQAEEQPDTGGGREQWEMKLKR